MALKAAGYARIYGERLLADAGQADFLFDQLRFATAYKSVATSRDTAGESAGSTKPKGGERWEFAPTNIY